MTKVLVIEDDDAVRANLLELLDAEYFSVMGAEDGRIGVQLAHEYLPDLIICDIMMPELDGYGVLAAVRQDTRLAAVPFVFLTAKSTPAEMRQGMNLGADDYLVKPFTRSQLLAAIGARLEKQAYVRTHFEERLEELRGTIAASLPHEFLTPLTIILAATEILIRHPDRLQAAEVSEIGRRVYSSAERLHRLIKNYMLYTHLEVARTDAQRATSLRGEGTSNTRVAIADVAARIARETGRTADLSLELSDASLRVSDTNLRKIVEELVDNAFRYSESGTRVIVRCYVRSAQTCILTVQDYGRGMTEDQIARVGAYVQFERERYEQQGQGLGIIVATRLAELYGGGLQIASIPGQETIVSVALPVHSGIRAEL